MRKNLMGEADASITVFLSLILTCICALMGGLFESVRTAGSGWYMQMALDSSLDSLMSKYHRDVWEQYRIFALEFDESGGLAAEMEPYLDSYFRDAPFYLVTDRNLTVSSPVLITDGGGRWFEKEILDYMKKGIWNVEYDAGILKETMDGVKEAESFGAIAEQYQECGRQLLKLEESIENIGESLERQKNYMEAGNRQLSNGNGTGFIKTAEKLKKELERIPLLVREYEEKAEELSREIRMAESGAAKKQGDLKSPNWELLSEEMESYRSYTDKEGSRHREVKQTEVTAERNKAVVEDAIRQAVEVQEYIDSWEPDDEDDELDEKRLWRRVLSVTGKFTYDSRFAGTGKKDRKKRKVLESLSCLAGSDLLSIVVPEGKKVSPDRIDKQQFPSVTEMSVTEMPGFTGYNGGAGHFLPETALLHEYAAGFYTNFLSEEERHVKYEQEYLLSGSASDRENLKNTVNQIIAIREAMNLMSLLKDPEKRREAELLAAAITGASGIAPLVSVTTFFILTVWALAESVEDVKALLEGGKVPFLKQGREWRVSLTGLAESGTALFRELGASGNEGEGLDYQSYLKLLFWLSGLPKKEYRMMDMIQKNIRTGQPSFLMRKCAYRLEAEYKGRGTVIPISKKAVKAY